MKHTRKKSFKKSQKGRGFTDDTLFSRIVKINHKVYGDIYTFGNSNLISSHIKNGEEWENDIVQVMAKYYIPGTDILDIGANIGFSSLGLNNLNKITGICHLFEPQCDVFFLLNLNTQSINRKLYNLALSDTYSMIVYEQNIGNIGATEVKNINNFKNTNNKIAVLSCALDTITFNNKISLIKIDVELNEIKLLNGALKTIKQHMPAIIIESFDQNNKNVEEILINLGYELKETLAQNNYVYTPKV